MNRKDSPQSVIDSYRRRQKTAPLLIAGLAVVLVIVGIVILVIWFRNNSNQPVVSFAAATASPTVTNTTAVTNTPVPPTATATVAPTETETPTITQTPTPSGPFEYKVESGDNCWSIATEKFKINPDLLLQINGFAPGTCPIQPGMTILIPLPDMKLPTTTPVPTGASETIDYYMQVGDTLADIAAAFHTSVDQIKKDNNVTDENKLKAGDKLTIHTNTATATPTPKPTNTKAPTKAPTATPTQKQ